MVIDINNFCEFITNNQKENEKILFDIGSYIIKNFQLTSKITNKKFFINDIEFYISSPNHQIDKNIETHHEITHCNQRQLENSVYYIHKTGKSYSLIQGSGIDFCFGCAKKCIYTGILIRELFDTQTNEIFHGPQKVLRTLLNLPKFYGEYKNDYINYALQIEKYKIYDKENLLQIDILKPPRNITTCLDKRVNVKSNLYYRVKANDNI